MTQKLFPLLLKFHHRSLFGIFRPYCTSFLIAACSYYVSGCERGGNCGNRITRLYKIKFPLSHFPDKPCGDQYSNQPHTLYSPAKDSAIHKTTVTCKQYSNSRRSELREIEHWKAFSTWSFIGKSGNQNQSRSEAWAVKTRARNRVVLFKEIKLQKDVNQVVMGWLKWVSDK